MPEERTRLQATTLGAAWAAVTLVLALGSPRLHNFLTHEGGERWRIDQEAAILLPVIGVVTLLIFLLPVRWAVRTPADSRRPAKMGVICSVIGLVGVLAFFLSVPIFMGSAGAMLGYEGLRRAHQAGGRGIALAALVLGVIAAVVGSLIWLLDAL